jgi:uncharacterized RDD family membrane protein YckC
VGNVGFGPRLVGYIIDAVIIGIAAFIITLILGIIKLGAIAQIVVIIGEFAYFMYFWNQSGQTIGGRVMGFKVVSEATGQPISYMSAFLRVIGYYISGIVILLGFLWVLWDPKKQGWMDKIAGTIVVPANTVSTM